MRYEVMRGMVYQSLYLLFAVLLLSQNAFAQKLVKETRYKSWSVNCYQQDKSDKQSCLLMQTIVLKETNSRLLQIAVAIQKDEVTARITIPLGVFLPNGLALQIDKGEQNTYPLLHCDQQGCHTSIRLNKTMLTGLKAGNQLTITFSDMSQRSIGVPVSLLGFTAGLKALWPMN